MPKEKPKEGGRGEKTRKKFLAYSDRLFFTRGLRKVTVEEICAGLGVSKRTFYKYFSDRDELVEVWFNGRLAELAPQIIGNLNSRKPVSEILELHFDILSKKFFGRISTQMMADIQTLMPELWERFEAFRRQGLQATLELIKRGQRSGAIRSDLDPELLGTIIQAVVPIVANPSFALERGFSLEQLTTNWPKIMLYGILTQRRREG
jgi:AcrR family transcriptional regulator